MTAEHFFTFAFWAAALWLAYTYAGYPLLLLAAALFRRVRPRVRDDFLPTVSVLIAARNEEQDIERTIREILAWDYPPDRLEVLVASDASEDRTDEIVRGIQDPRLSLLQLERRSGKARALNRLAAKARGEILYFTDANSQTDAGALRRMVRYFADEGVGCVTGHTQNAGADDPTGARLYWNLELLTKRLETRLGSVLVCDGAIFCMRRSLFRPLLPDLANDFELPLWVGHQGYWTLLEPKARVAEKDTSSPAEEFARRRRICAQGALGMWKLRRELRGLRLWQCTSHKLLRWLMLIPMVGLLLSTAALARSTAFALVFGLQLAFYAAATAGLLLVSRGRSATLFLSAPFYIVLTTAGALVGVIDACRGRSFDIWESAALTRGVDAASCPRTGG